MTSPAIIPRKYIFSTKMLLNFRTFATAATSTASSLHSGSVVEEKISRLPNGLTVASVDLDGPITQLLVAFKAGSRYEQPDEQGLVHYLRNIIGTDSKKYSGVKLLWQTGNIGANIISSTSKDLLVVQSSVIRTHDKIALSILGELAQPAFKSWDVTSREETLNTDLVFQSPMDLIIENLHKAAYRNGSLATPLLTPAHQIGKHSFKQLSAYAKARMLSWDTALVGINIDHQILLAYATEQVPVAEGRAKVAVPSPYCGGGDVRTSGDTPLAHVAIIGHTGARLTDVRSVAIQAVLCAAFGKVIPSTKLMSFPKSDGIGVIARHVLKVANHNPVAIHPLNIVHSDSSLAGVYLVANGDHIHTHVHAAVAGLAEIAKSGLSIDALSLAKYTVELETLVRAESSSALALDIAAQVLANGSISSPADFIQLLHQVSTDDVKKAASRLISSKLSMSAYGAIHQIPYVESFDL